MVRSAMGVARSRTAVLVVAVFTKSAMVVSFPRYPGVYRYSRDKEMGFGAGDESGEYLRTRREMRSSGMRNE